jgi:hypothetical protein
MLGLGALTLAARATNEEEQAIRTHIEQTYFAGPRTGNVDLARQAFAPSLVMYWVKDGKLQQLTRDEWVARVAEGAKKKAGTDDVQRRILEVDVTGTAAMAKIEISKPGMRIVDYMSLLKVDGSWVIVGKTFDKKSTVAAAN